jgi:hypothetical protein
LPSYEGLPFLTVPIIKNSPQINEFSHEVWGKFTADIVCQKTQHHVAQVNLNVRKLKIERNLPIPQFTN